MKKRLALLTVMLFACSPASADEHIVTQPNTVDVQIVDYTGKPPFKRKVVSLPVSDLAQLEALGSDPVEYVEVKEVIMRGKPPYRRTTKQMPVYDVAQFELIGVQEDTGKKGSRPPFKRH